ncbi:unnamed protein product [Darwinula stevensoni]|uniref:MAGUK p55 subfamily member 5 n=1 Tax=Darwinula stevensoni TaxID=69355 RepID=A0A7R8XIJ5_9CRUS|nr:unnamed protein product [Darwinula stevensoni]CAG0894381.1 unnamed protein product [Darwinula stevensoni]
MVDLGGYVIILVETKDKKIKLYGSPADRADLEIGDEILEVNGRSLENCSHTDVISHIHQCIRSRTICLRVKRKSTNRLAIDLAQHSSVQDAFVIAVEQQARERLERLSALKKIKPVDMTKLSQQLSGDNQIEQAPSDKEDFSGFIENNPVYNISVPELQSSQTSLNNIGIKSEPKSRSPGDNRKSGVDVVKQAKVIPLHETSYDGNQVTGDTCSDNKPLASPREGTGSDSVLPGNREVLLRNKEPGTDSSSVVNQSKSSQGAEKFGNDQDSEEDMRQNGSANKAYVRKSGTGAEPQYSNVINMVEFDGTGREMAVDVPEGFMARTKTPPRYPPPKTNQLGSAKRRSAGSNSTSIAVTAPVVSNGSIQKAAQPPSDPVPVQNDLEQQERVRKYQEELAQRREQEARKAAEEDFLRSSLRGSEKLQALEQKPQLSPHHLNDSSGLVNDAYDEEDPLKSVVQDQLMNLCNGQFTELTELLDCTHRLQKQLKGMGQSIDLLPVTELLTDPLFRKTLAIYNYLCGKPPPSPCQDNVQSLVQECILKLKESSCPEAMELMELLHKENMRGILHVHDQVAMTLPLPVSQDSAILDRAAHYTDGSVKVVTLEKTSDPLGATVRNEGEAVVIGRIVKGGAAARTGLLHEGDEILDVNGISMRGKNVNDVCDILAGMTGTLEFIISPARTERAQPQPTPTPVMHVKAHFDYDPDDDPYIPCRELGLNIRKGEILHVIDREDPHWWQAYREGEEDMALAGLIPSQSFQEQREAIKQSIVDDGNNMHSKHRKSATLLCARKSGSKKRKRMYNSELNEDAEAEEILTYEEVGLYYPRANRKRPIVLIGPPNIGRHELRQKLMERDVERFAAAIPQPTSYFPTDTSRPKKDTEVDGQDYYFITRPQFEADILARKFVEHGEYEKQYYGTSLDAIRSVVNSGKICVLNLHPQSLKILKNSDLKPFVVFIAPPNLEMLKRNRQKMGLSVKDEELKSLIEKARDMEAKYGHYLDLTLVNVDLERTYQQLIHEINLLEREPQWVPVTWLKNEIPTNH